MITADAKEQAEVRKAGVRLAFTHFLSTNFYTRRQYGGLDHYHKLDGLFVATDRHAGRTCSANSRLGKRSVDRKSVV